MIDPALTQAASTTFATGGIPGIMLGLSILGYFFIGRWFLQHLAALTAQHKSEREEWRDFLKEITTVQDSRQKETNLVVEGLTHAIQSKLYQGKPINSPPRSKIS